MRSLQFFLVCVLSALASAQMTADQWREDLDTLAEGLLEKHPNFYTKHTVEQFEDALSTLDEQLEVLDDQQIVMELSRLVAMGGDSHTGIGLGDFAAEMRQLPIEMVVLDDGVFVHAAAEQHKELIGREILTINGVAIEEVINRIGALFAHENHWKLINAGASYARLAPALAAVGVIDRFDADHISIDFESDETRDLKTILIEQRAAMGWTSFIESIDPRPLMYTMQRGYYGSRFLDEHGVMYIAYNSCREAPDLPVAQFAEFITTKSDELNARRLIIDLRFNGGGDETVIWPLMEALENFERFKNKGDIIVLTSRYTYSSAMSNAHLFRDRCGAILMGEPTGGKPNHFGQLGSFTLPNSGLTVHHSTKYFHKVEGDPDAVHPDVRIGVHADDFFNGKDPVLEAAIEYQAD